ncbi:hypothetical protein [Chitinophaga sp.]|uniref:hypothetical protein n=1 Tax=Chitinophaga sp. TaxID=1869181 RepID=UPI002F929747
MNHILLLSCFLLLPVFAIAQERTTDTVPKEPTSDTIPKVKKLKEVTVKARWQDRHLALNKQYVVKDEFKAIEHFTFDLRDPINPGKQYYVLEFLIRELPPGWQSHTLSSCPGVQYFVDEVEVSGDYAATLPLKDFAYAKIFQDLHPPCPAIVLYTRKGDDLRRRRAKPITP